MSGRCATRGTPPWSTRARRGRCSTTSRARSSSSSRSSPRTTMPTTSAASPSCCEQHRGARLRPAQRADPHAHPAGLRGRHGDDPASSARILGARHPGSYARAYCLLWGRLAVLRRHAVRLRLRPRVRRHAAADVRVAREAARAARRRPRSTAGTNTRSPTSASPRRVEPGNAALAARENARPAACATPASPRCRAPSARRRPPTRSCAAASRRWSSRSTSTSARAFPIRCAYSPRSASGRTGLEKTPPPRPLLRCCRPAPRRRRPSLRRSRSPSAAAARRVRGRAASRQPAPAPTVDKVDKGRQAQARFRRGDAPSPPSSPPRRSRPPTVRRPVGAHPQGLRHARPRRQAGQAEDRAVRRAARVPAAHHRAQPALPLPHRRRDREARPADRARAAADGRERLQPDGLLARARLGPVAVHPAAPASATTSSRTPGTTAGATSSTRPTPRSTT